MSALTIESLEPAYRVQGTLALVRPTPDSTLPDPETPVVPAARKAPTAQPTPLAALATFGPQHPTDVVHVAQGTRAQMEAHAHRFAQAVVEIIGGDRPSAQVLRLTTVPVYQQICRRARLAVDAQTRRRSPLEATPIRSRRVTVRPVVASVRLSFVTGSAVEATVRVRHGERSRAMAARFELVGERWQCCALQFA